MLAKPINWVLCIAKNINVMTARIQLTRERQHVLTQATELRVRDVFADQENSQSPPCQISLLTPRARTAGTKMGQRSFALSAATRAVVREALLRALAAATAMTMQSHCTTRSAAILRVVVQEL